MLVNDPSMPRATPRAYLRRPACNSALGSGCLIGAQTAQGCAGLPPGLPEGFCTVTGCLRVHPFFSGRPLQAA